MKFWIAVIVSASRPRLAAIAPMTPDSAPQREFLGLVEEAAALEESRALLGGDLDIARSEEEDLVGDPLHAAVEGVRQAAGKVDQPLRELLIGALQVEDDRDRLLELVGDLLRVVEAARDDEMDARRARPRQRLDDGSSALGAEDSRARGRARLGRLGIGPVVEVAAVRPARCESAHVRPLGVAALELLVRQVAVLVPVLLLGDAEVDEGLVPDVPEAHRAECYPWYRTDPTRISVAPSSAATR